MKKQLKPLLKVKIPELYDEIYHLLKSDGEEKLANNLMATKIIDKCRCGDDFCSSIYAASKPSGSWVGPAF